MKMNTTGTRLVSGSDHKHVLIFDVEEATVLGKLKGHTQSVHDVAIRNDLIASGGRDNVSLKLLCLSDRLSSYGMQIVSS